MPETGAFYANIIARSAIRRANVVEEARIHADRHADSGVGHWREYGDCQCRQRSAVAPAAVRATGSDGDDLGQFSKAQHRTFACEGGGIPRLPVAKSELRASG